jgi:hypothetical protein
VTIQTRGAIFLFAKKFEVERLDNILKNIRVGLFNVVWRRGAELVSCAGNEEEDLETL